MKFIVTIADEAEAERFIDFVVGFPSLTGEASVSIEPHEEFPLKWATAMVEASSLGTSEAKALRSSVSDDQTAAVMRRVRELEHPDAPQDTQEVRCMPETPKRQSATHDLADCPCPRCVAFRVADQSAPRDTTCPCGATERKTFRSVLPPWKRATYCCNCLRKITP